ncbi:MAG: 50S ribosomal protein L9 [Candidatus Wallbacteria bacterium]|nr:50S ribosomal protein L9 [Candidatus Wallbacteria bacterium]
MQVILRADIDNLGGKNEVLKVKDGYARNFLFPRKLAIPATAGNMKDLKEKIRVAEDLKKKRISAAKEVAEALSRLHIRVVKKAGKEGKLFGSVTPQEVADKVFELSGLTVDKRKLNLPEHVKNLGVYHFTAKLDTGVSATLRLEIAGELEDEPAHEEPLTAEAMHGEDQVESSAS